ncbi:kelch domain-containing protein 3-like [Babylonia areolata]|uniref:kelch domain-containing protein 3-like n=1 Tax=Babylonia areolata TaxID=304850 RepID=UPI003FD09CDD
MPHWTVRLEGGPRRVNHAAISAGHKIFSFGGYCSGEDYEQTRPIDVHVLNTVTLRWTSLPPVKPEEERYVPYKRYGHTAVNYNDHAYIWGGRNDGDGACDVLFCFDTETLSWSCPEVGGYIPAARDGHTACVIDHKMYIFGGYEELTDLFSDQIFTLDFRDFSWALVRFRTGVPENICRDFHTATAVGSKMYVFGGRSDDGGVNFTNSEIYDNSMLAFDTLTSSWEVIPCQPGFKPVGRRSHSTFEYNGCLYVFGGYNGLMDQHFADMYKFNLDTRKWSTVHTGGRGPCARRRQCCCMIESKVHLFGGTSPRPQRESSVESQRRVRSADLVDHSDLHVLDFTPSLKTLCQVVVIENNLDRSQLPDILRWELDLMTRNNTISRALNNG